MSKLKSITGNVINKTINMTQEEKNFSFPNKSKEAISKEVKDRIIAKAVSSIVGINRTITKYEEPIGGISDEQRQTVIESSIREKETWLGILKLVDYGKDKGIFGQLHPEVG